MISVDAQGHTTTHIKFRSWKLRAPYNQEYRNSFKKKGRHFHTVRIVEVRLLGKSEMRKVLWPLT